MAADFEAVSFLDSREGLTKELDASEIGALRAEVLLHLYDAILAHDYRNRRNSVIAHNIRIVRSEVLRRLNT